jgi:hypothetical protein
MTMALNDQQRRRALRAVVAGATVVLDGLHRVGGSLADGPERDRNGMSRVAVAARRRLTTGTVPGSPGWAERPLDDRCRWWADRIGELTGAPATVPRLLGSLGGKLPIAAVLDSAGRGLVVCAVAREIGGLDPDRQVDLIAAVTLGRSLRSDDDTGPAADDEPATGPGAADLLRSTIQLGTTLHRAVGDRRDRSPGPPVPGPRITDRVVLVGLYRSVSERKKALREVAAQTIDLATGPTRPVPTGSDS